MTRQELANQLRQRQYARGLVDKSILDAASDDQIIDAYTTCSECGKRDMSEANLERTIQLARDVEEFFRLSNLHVCGGDV